MSTSARSARTRRPLLVLRGSCVKPSPANQFRPAAARRNPADTAALAAGATSVQYFGACPKH
jgi:hypothetical protein